jgi:hypothetical protein
MPITTAGPIGQCVPMPESEPRIVWIPQATLEGSRDDVNIFDIGAFTSETEARRAADQWLAERPSRWGEPPQIDMNVVAVYESAEEWQRDQ